MKGHTMTNEDKDLLMRRVAAYCAVLVVIGFFSILAMQFFFEIPKVNKDGFNQMIGALILAFGGLMGYLYGASKNGEATSRAMTALATSVVPPVTPTTDPTTADPMPVTIQNPEPVDVAVVPPSKPAVKRKMGRK